MARAIQKATLSRSPPIAHRPSPIADRRSPIAHRLSTKDLLELLRRNDFELRKGAVARTLVRSPTPELRRVSKPSALHVVVRDFDDQLRPKRLPRQILVGAPATRRARFPLRAIARPLPLGPRLPWVRFDRVLTEG